MGLWARLIGREQRAAAIQSSDPYLAEFFGQRDTGSGVSVSPFLAENLSTVFACVQCIAETVASLRLHVYRKTETGRLESFDHPVARIFSGDPNETQSAFEFVETLSALCMLRGNAYAEIIRDGRGAPVALVPLHPDLVAVLRIPRTGRYVYELTGPDGGTRRLLQDEMFHLRDRSDDGILGKSRLHRARETFGAALATERYAGSTFRNGAALSGVLTHPQQLDEASAQRLRSSFEAIYRGAENAGRVAILEEGLQWQQISVSPDDAQMLESRRFSVEQLARIFRVPPPIIGHMESGSSYASVSELGRWFVQYSIVPWLRRWESTIERLLLSQEARRFYEIEFDTDELLRGDMLTRFQSYRIAREIGVYNANELRRFENQNPRNDAGGNEYFSPQNMQGEQTGAPKDREPVIA